jgi:hypothetical protein
VQAGIDDVGEGDGVMAGIYGGMRRGGCWSIGALIVLLLSVVSACSGGNPSATATAATTTTTATATATAERMYKTKKFAAPLTTSVPEPFAVQPSAETQTFLTWVAADPNRVRFLLPAVVYRIGGKVAVEPPVDYMGFFEAEAAKGQIDISDRSTRKVGGRTAEVFTAETMGEVNVDGLFGCPAPDMDPAGEDCFGPQYGYTVRIAVITVNDGAKPIVAWTSVKDVYRDELQAVFGRFHAMLDSIVFQ